MQARAHSRKKLHASVLFLAQNMFAAACLVPRAMQAHADDSHPEQHADSLGLIKLDEKWHALITVG